MFPKPAPRFLTLGIAMVMLFGGSNFENNQEPVSAEALASTPSTIFTQPGDPAGTLLQSSLLDPDGSNNDKYVWDNFTLSTGGMITEIDWVGGFDPLRFGAGGPVVDFRISIYPSIAAGTEPAVAFPPLAQYSTGGNAGQTSIGMLGSIPMYAYAYTLPAPFSATAGQKYWVQIQAFQQGSNPDWGIAGGTGGNSSHYVRESGAGGDIRYHSAPGDAAFTLLGTANSNQTYLPFTCGN